VGVGLVIGLAATGTFRPGARAEGSRGTGAQRRQGRAASQSTDQSSGSGSNQGQGSNQGSGGNSGPGSNEKPGMDGAAVTFTRDVAPILQARCQECHRPGGIGPFPLLTYGQAKVWAPLIADYTRRRVMPPWKAAPNYGEFEGERRLADAEIETLSRWVEAGTPEGDPRDLPPPRTFPDGWQLGPPDLVLDAGAAFPVPANKGDIYREFVLPFHPDKDQWVTAAEVLPDARAVVHHVDLFLDPKGLSPAADRAAPGLGFPSAGFGPELAGIAQIDAWAAGSVPRFTPAGTAWRVPAHAYLVMEVHYSPTPKAVSDRTRIGLHFAHGPVDKRVRTGRIGNERFVVPAGAAGYEVPAGMALPEAITMLSVWPHMHLIGKELKAAATLPEGLAKPVVWVQDWDVHWQLSYAFKQPLSLPPGARLDLSARYDNTANNPFNPFRPPRAIAFGPSTTDEMCYLFFRYTVEREHLTQGVAVEKDGIEL
jgi:mono/diheme cytochrome c family protein